MLKKKIWANFQRIIELFTQKIATKLSKIWVWDPRSGKKPIPDLGSGSATLLWSAFLLFIVVYLPGEWLIGEERAVELPQQVVQQQHHGHGNPRPTGGGRFYCRITICTNWFFLVNGVLDPFWASLNPDPDPRVFGPPGSRSGSISLRHGSKMSWIRKTGLKDDFLGWSDKEKCTVPIWKRHSDLCTHGDADLMLPYICVYRILCFFLYKYFTHKQLLYR
jgi:hypothetical protein